MKVAIVGTSAGTCILDVAGEGPCPRCLIDRLEEAGFDVARDDLEVGEAELPAAICDALAEPGAVVLVGRSGTASRHRLLPIPGCDHCGAASGKVAEEVLFDPLLGIASAITVEDPAAGGLVLVHAASARVHIPVADGKLWAGGHGFDARGASIGLRGEAAERYAGCHADPRRLVHAPARDMGVEDSRWWPEPAAHGYAPIGPDVPIAWTRGRSLRDGAEHWIPAASVYLTRGWRRDEPRFAPQLTTGMAAHRTAADACARGVYEVLERHALTVAWHRQQFGADLAVEIVLRGQPELAQRLHEHRLRATLRVLACPPAAPVVLAALSGEVFPFIALGFAARPTLLEAALKALGEASVIFQQAHARRDVLAGGAAIPADGDPIDHVVRWATPARRDELLQRLSAAPPSQAALDDIVAAPRAIAQLVEAAGDAFVVDVTPPDLAACGVHVARVLAPTVPTFGFGAMQAPRAVLARHGITACDIDHPFG